MNGRIDRRLDEVKVALGVDRRSERGAEALTDEELREVGAAIALAHGHAPGSAGTLAAIRGQHVRLAVRFVATLKEYTRMAVDPHGGHFARLGAGQFK